MRRAVLRLLPALGAAALALHPQPVDAQAPADSAGLARAAARFIAQDLVAEFTAVRGVAIAPPTTPFDSLVARELAGYPEFQRTGPDSALFARVGTRGFVAELSYPSEEQRGLPAVLVHVSGCTPGGGWGDGWHWWSNQTWYVFRRTEAGWEPVSARLVDNADGGCSPPAAAKPG